MKSWIPNKFCLIVFTILILSLYLLSFYFNCRIYDMLRLRTITHVRDSRSYNRTRTILFWNTMFGSETFYFGDGDIFRECPVNDCYATHDRNYADLLDFDAVLFHANELELSDLPTRRGTRQWYVFVNLESPANKPLQSYFYEDFFNLTMTYRLDSDVVWTYGFVREVNTGKIVAPARNVSWSASYDSTGEANRKNGSLSKVIEGKTKPIIWFVSNCEAKSGRQAYTKELSRHIRMDVYGRCGNVGCPTSKDCFADVAEPDYFFYLSFENSFCQDYVTEKLYNALRYNIVPIVYGGANYSMFAPPGSYINAFDFDTPKDLAEYLKRLMADPREYSKYFEWKKRYEIDRSNRPTICKLCEFLHRRRAPKTYNRLSDWYSRSKCPLQNFLTYYSYVSGAMIKHKSDITVYL